MSASHLENYHLRGVRARAALFNWRTASATTMSAPTNAVATSVSKAPEAVLIVGLIGPTFLESLD
jgi:hypothetical protein